MKPATRAALKLPAGATDADAAAALDKGGHGLSLRDLEKSDADLVLYLKKQQPEVYANLYRAAYGKAPQAAPAKGQPAPAARADAGKGQQAKVKLAALGADVTLRQLEQQDPALVLELKHHAPAEYGRLFALQYGGAVPEQPADTVVQAQQLSAPTVEGATGSYRPKKPLPIMRMTDVSNMAEVFAAIPLIGDLAQDDRFERLP